MEKLGIESIDQQAYNRFAGRDDVKGFTKEVKKRTGGEGMHLVCDMLRGPVFAAGLAALAREGVNVSAGWQLDTKVNYNSAGASTKQITLDHTHYETLVGVEAATELYGKVFKPDSSQRDLQVRRSPSSHGGDARGGTDGDPHRASCRRDAGGRQSPALRCSSIVCAVEG